MKIAVLTVAFNESELIKGCIEQFNNKFWHQVLVSEKPWNGECEPDDTHVVALNCGANVIVGTWGSEAEQRNYGLEILKDYDWVIICDADERYTALDIESIEADILFWNSSEVSALGTSYMEVYWKTPDYRIIPPQEDFPIIAIRPNQKFKVLRSSDALKAGTNAQMHHFSYVRSDEKMLCKINSFDHANDFDTNRWYENVWLNWTPDKEFLHPIVPSQFFKAIWNPCPDELRKYLP